MKIAIPVDEKEMKTNVGGSFGRTPFYLIYDTETKENNFIENTAATSAGGAGIKAAQIIVDSKVEALLTPQCGVNASNVLKAADIKIFKTTNASLKESIGAFVAGKLSLLEDIHAGYHGAGGK